MNIVIRHEEPEDFKVVEEVAREAFWNLYFPGCEEHFVIHKMRQHCDFISDLSFILQVDGETAGGIFYTHSKIIAEDKREYATISFGPVFIAPQYQRKGLGRKLITHSIRLARENGHRAIITLGYPKHYEPYGFMGGKRYGLAMADGKFYIGLLVLPLYPDALKEISGIVAFSDVFEIDPQEVEEFDRSFPAKEKRVQPSQKEYDAVVAMLDE